MKTKTFEEKVKAMTFKQLVETMVESLENPAIEVDMGSFGGAVNGVCYGCAATNTICKISGVVFTPDNILEPHQRAEKIMADSDFLIYFERSVDLLRRGDIDKYCYFATFIKMPMPSKEQREIFYKSNNQYLLYLNSDLANLTNWKKLIEKL